MIILLFLLWIVLNGRFSADAGMVQVCVVGAAVSAFAYFFAHKALGYTLKAELRWWKKAPVLLAYFFILIKEIIIAIIENFFIKSLPKIKYIILKNKCKGKPRS